MCTLRISWAHTQAWSCWEYGNFAYNILWRRRLFLQQLHRFTFPPKPIFSISLPTLVISFLTIRHQFCKGHFRSKHVPYPHAIAKSFLLLSRHVAYCCSRLSFPSHFFTPLGPASILTKSPEASQGAPSCQSLSPADITGSVWSFPSWLSRELPLHPRPREESDPRQFGLRGNNSSQVQGLFSHQLPSRFLLRSLGPTLLLITFLSCVRHVLY